MTTSPSIFNGIDTTSVQGGTADSQSLDKQPHSDGLSLAGKAEAD